MAKIGQGGEKSGEILYLKGRQHPKMPVNRPSMEVEFRPTAEDYRGFYRYYAFRRYIGMRIAVIGLFSVAIGFESRHSSWDFHLLPALVVGAILFIILMGVPYIISIIKNRKELQRLQSMDFRWRIELTGDGFLVQKLTDQKLTEQTGTEQTVTEQTVTETGPELEKKFWR